MREGEDREELGRTGFAERAQRLTAEAQADLRQLLASLGCDVQSDRWVAGGAEAVHAARVAFVRLYEAGLLLRNDTVVDSCPSCETVVDAADVDEVEMDVLHLRLRLATTTGELEIDVAEPELLVGVVAVAVPPGHEAAGTTAFIPLLDAEVPVVPLENAPQPAMVVPGHFHWAHEVARQIGAPTTQVLDGEGVVRHPGPFEGLSRYAARAAATEALAVDGAVVARFEEKIPVKRCHRCATVLVSLRGRHWVLDMHHVVEPVLERLRAGEIAFAPVAAFDRMVEVAGNATGWTVSQQLWSGEPIPASTCLDCGQTTVSVDQPDSCPSCMGTLQPDPDVLDARFIAAVTPLAMLGWPNSFDEQSVTGTSLSVGRYGLDVWALPMAALGLRLAGLIPFANVLVHQFAIGAPEMGQRKIAEMSELINASGQRVVRAALLHGDLDLERAEHTVSLIDDPATGGADMAALREAYDKAIASLDPGEALIALTNAAREGVAEADRDELRSLGAPLLGS